MRAPLVGLLLAFLLATGCGNGQPEPKPHPETPAATAGAPAPAAPRAPDPAADQGPAIPEPPAGAVVVAVDQAGSLTLPAPGMESDGETHMRHPWKMPAGKGSALAVVRWKDEGWKDIKVDVGVGICPHRGRALATATGSGGTVVVRYDAPAGTPADDPNWFLHVNADTNLDAKPGETLAYTYSIHAW